MTHPVRSSRSFQRAASASKRFEQHLHYPSWLWRWQACLPWPRIIPTASVPVFLLNLCARLPFVVLICDNLPLNKKSQVAPLRPAWDFHALSFRGMSE
jgi:hypothetical protein